MYRSHINQTIREAIQFFEERRFPLPPWAYWHADAWRGQRAAVDEIMSCGLGWDITDFGSGDFDRIGLINFNLRNGIVNQTRKTYCEKIIIVRENQVTPLHTHRSKIEDIINRGGGNLVIELAGSDADLSLNESPVTVRVDGFARTVPAGGAVVLTPGESICLEPGMYHKFWGQPGTGTVLVGEVSTVNDDNTDNVFVGGNPRFPTIVEDEPPAYLLVNDYRVFV